MVSSNFTFSLEVRSSEAMGTDNLGKFEGCPIDLNAPICSLPRNIMWPLCVNLSVEQSVFIEGSGGDWKSLGSYIHLPAVMEERIEEYSRGKKTTPAFVLLDLWDRGIKKNPGSIRKLLIALHQSGMVTYLNQHILAPLQGIKFLVLQTFDTLFYS